MQLMTFDSVLTYMCDYFDELISPRKMTRSNTNIGYLILKAVSKGIEVINNACVVLSNKFNPANCSDEDLTSVADLVGTAKLKGAQSGLRVLANNNGTQVVTLLAGTYTYQLDADTAFICELLSDLQISAESYAELIFLSDKLGSFAVTEQQSITVTSENTIPSSIVFSCSNNDALLGYSPETNLEFRKRVMSDTERQDAINELKIKLRNLPYVFDCEIVFNRDTSSTVVGDFTIPPYYMLILMSTAMYKEEIAKIIAESAIYPTVNVVNESHEIKYYNGVFADGYYPVYINDFADKDFIANVTFQVDTTFTSVETAKAKLRDILFTAINSNVRKDIITSEDFFNAVNRANLVGITLIGVTFQEGASVVPYINCLKTEIAKLDDIVFNPLSGE